MEQNENKPTFDKEREDHLVEDTFEEKTDDKSVENMESAPQQNAELVEESTELGEMNQENSTMATQPTIKEENQPAKTDSPKRQKSSRPGLHGLVGGVVGGLVSATAVILLFTNNIIPLPSDNTAQSATIEQKETADVITTMASDNAVKASTIAEASEAVVGVINLQQQNIWTPNEEAGTGSGIIYKKENGKAYVVTNHHVVDGAQEVEIVLNNEERIKAKVLGSDELTDLAVLQVDGSKIETVANLGSSKDIKIGETAIAIGNPLGMEFANSLTMGIISGLNRAISIDTNGDLQPDWITEVIQTDAAINPGNSGGALVDANGNVIGINSMKIAKREVEGIGSAIPIDSAIPIMEQLESKGEVARPFIGISTAALEQVPRQYRNRIILPDTVEGGMVIANVETGSPADHAGLKQFDVITKINGEEITSILELRKYMYSETAIGDTVKIEIYRDGKQKIVELQLSERETL